MCIYKKWFLIHKIEGLKLDERISELLRIADQTNKEYVLFLDALDKNTRATLKDQWEKRYIYNTNSIEGNTMSAEDVSEELAKELHSIIQKNITDVAGVYKNFYNYIEPSCPTTPLRYVKKRMNSLMEWHKKTEITFTQ